MREFHCKWIVIVVVEGFVDVFGVELKLRCESKQMAIPYPPTIRSEQLNANDLLITTRHARDVSTRNIEYVG